MKKTLTKQCQQLIIFNVDICSAKRYPAPLIHSRLFH